MTNSAQCLEMRTRTACQTRERAPILRYRTSPLPIKESPNYFAVWTPQSICSWHCPGKTICEGSWQWDLTCPHSPVPIKPLSTRESWLWTGPLFFKKGPRGHQERLLPDLCKTQPGIRICNLVPHPPRKVPISWRWYSVVDCFMLLLTGHLADVSCLSEAIRDMEQTTNVVHPSMYTVTTAITPV